MIRLVRRNITFSHFPGAQWAEKCLLLYHVFICQLLMRVLAWFWLRRLPWSWWWWPTSRSRTWCGRWWSPPPSRTRRWGRRTWWRPSPAAGTAAPAPCSWPSWCCPAPGGRWNVLLSSNCCSQVVNKMRTSHGKNNLTLATKISYTGGNMSWLFCEQIPNLKILIILSVLTILATLSSLKYCAVRLTSPALPGVELSFLVHFTFTLPMLFTLFPPQFPAQSTSAVPFRTAYFRGVSKISQSGKKSQPKAIKCQRIINYVQCASW